MKCADCKFWKPKEKYSKGHHLGLGLCLNTPMFWDATKWADDGDARALKEEYSNTKAFVQDSSDYEAELLTMPDFGCVSFETKAG